MTLATKAASAVACWKLDEASGNRADSVGSSTLTDTNTVASATGMFGNCADFEADNTEYLTVTDNAALSVGDVDFMIRAWVQLESKTTNRTIVSKRKNATNREYILQYESAGDRFRLAVTSAGSSFTLVSADNFGSPSLATWYLVGISVNAGTADTAAHAGGIFDGVSDLRLGHDEEDNGEYWDGLLDDVVILKGAFLDATERTADYNGGAGVAFADWTLTGQPTVKRWGGVQSACKPFRRRQYAKMW